MYCLETLGKAGIYLSAGTGKVYVLLGRRIYDEKKGGGRDEKFHPSIPLSLLHDRN